MFETLVAAPSPARSRLAVPASALGHGAILMAALLAAHWVPEEPPMPGLPIESLIPMHVVSLGETRGGPVAPPRPRRDAPAKTASKEVYPKSIPDSVPVASPEDSRAGLESGSGKAAVPGGLPGDDSGRCPACPSTPGDGDQAVSFEAVGLAPVLVLRVEPSYPETMRRIREEGTVAINAIIGRDGTIEEASVLTGTNALFEAEALRAVRQWRYEPGRLNGRPVRVRLLVSVSFRLR